jgi:hypothetical protein
MIVFLKVKKSTFYQVILYRFKEIKDNLFPIRCAIRCDINIINTLFAYQWFFGL